MTIGSAGPSVRASPGTIEVTNERVFGPGGETWHGALRRVLSFAEVQSWALDPIKATAVLNYRLANGDTCILLGRLARAIGEPDAGLDEPSYPAGQKVSRSLFIGTPASSRSSS